MNLKNKKRLAARTLGVGAGRIAFREDRTPEISEAITKQDIRDLADSKAIYIKEIKGRLVKERAGKRGAGKIKKKINRRKREYMRLTRKLRKFARQLLLQGRITKEQYKNIRKQIKAKLFRSKAHFKEISKPEAKQIRKEKKDKKELNVKTKDNLK